MKRISIVAVLTLLASALVGLAGTRPAWAGSSTQTTIFVDPAESSYFGRTISLSGRVFDNECIANCQHPQGHIDYYRATSAADFETTKVFLRSSDSLSFDTAKTGTADPVPYCCLPVGTWLIKGFYVPLTTGWDPSSDEADNLHTVSQRPTTMTLTQSSTTSSLGQAVTFTATVTPFEDDGFIGHLDATAARPTGTVTFSEDPDANTHIQYGTVGISQSGQASVSPTTLTVGTHHIKAVYNADTNYEGAHESVDHTVTKASSATSFSLSPTISTYGDTITMTAAVSPSGTTGSVAFQDVSGVFPVTFATRQLGVTPHQAVFTSSSPLDAGSYSMAATYNGDGNYASSTSNAVGVTVNKADSTTAIGASPDTSRFGQQVTFTATVSGPGTLGGSVQFFDGDANLGFLQPLTAGVATLTISTLPAGAHTISAEYTGDANHNGSGDGPLSLDVSKADTATSLTSSGTPTPFGDPVTFTATVGPVAPGGGTPPGSVQFKDGSSDLGPPQPLSGGTASLTSSTLGGGTHDITAVYAGDDNYNGSTGAVSQTVTCDHTVEGSGRSLTVSPTGSTCISGGTIKGNLTVPAGAKLSLVNATVVGRLTVRNAGRVIVCGTSVANAVSVSGATGFVLLGDPGDDACAPNNFHGAVKLVGNHGGVELAGNKVGGAVTVNFTTGAGPFPEDGATEIESNTIGGTLKCTGNSPLATNDGHPNSVSGARGGECAKPGF